MTQAQRSRLHLVPAVFTFLLAAGYFVSSATNLVQAESPGPVITGGSSPWLSFTGVVSPFSTDTVYTVPADKVFVVTLGCQARDGGGPHEDFSLREGSTLRVPGGSRAMYCGGTSSGLPQYTPTTLAAGVGRVTYQPGTTVTVQNWPDNISDPDYGYYIEGYLGEP